MDENSSDVLVFVVILKSNQCVRQEQLINHTWLGCSGKFLFRGIEAVSSLIWALTMAHTCHNYRKHWPKKTRSGSVYVI